MNKLLKANFYHIFKSKLTLIAFILVPVMPLLATLIFYGLALLLLPNGMSHESVRTMFQSKTLISNAYSISSNLGLVIPVFSGIFICADISNGTLRNKIIVGNSKLRIYLSHLISSIIFNVILISIYAALTVLFSTLFFEYGEPIDANETKTLIYFFIYGTILYVYLATLSTLIALVFKSMGPTIIFTILFALGFSLFTTLLAAFNIEKIKLIAEFIPTYPISKFMLGDQISKELFIKSISSLGLISLFNIICGILCFNNQDIK